MSSQSYQFDAATFTVSWSGSGNYSIALVYGGSGYSNGVTTFTVKAPQFSVGPTTALGLAASPTNDLVFTVTNTNGQLSAPVYVSGAGPTVAGSVTISLEYSVANFIMRDASDITRALKERIIYNEKRTGSPINSGKGGSLVPGRPGVNPGAKNNIPAGNAEVLWIPQGNQYRLSYLFGKLKCGAGSAGAFNLNGPLSSS
jgi:hypothetical protein